MGRVGGAGRERNRRGLAKVPFPLVFLAQQVVQLAPRPRTSAPMGVARRGARGDAMEVEGPVPEPSGGRVTAWVHPPATAAAGKKRGPASGAAAGESGRPATAFGLGAEPSASSGLGKGSHVRRPRTSAAASESISSASGSNARPRAHSSTSLSSQQVGKGSSGRSRSPLGRVLGRLRLDRPLPDDPASLAL